MCHGHIWYSGTLHGQNTPSELFSTRYEQNSGRNTGTEAVKTVKNSKFQIHVNGLKILKSKKSCLLLLRRSKHDFLNFKNFQTIHVDFEILNFNRFNGFCTCISP